MSWSSVLLVGGGAELAAVTHRPIPPWPAAGPGCRHPGAGPSMPTSARTRPVSVTPLGPHPGAPRSPADSPTPRLPRAGASPGACAVTRYVRSGSRPGSGTRPGGQVSVWSSAASPDWRHAEIWARTGQSRRSDDIRGERVLLAGEASGGRPHHLRQVWGRRGARELPQIADRGPGPAASPREAPGWTPLRGDGAGPPPREGCGPAPSRASCRSGHGRTATPLLYLMT